MTKELYQKGLDLLKEKEKTKLRIERAEADVCWLTPQSWKNMSRKEQVELVNSGDIQFPYNMEVRERLYRAVDEAKRQWRMDRSSVLERNAMLKRREL
jgi:hypothetical protein|tara:strand:- start:275 stop:568 length:294 start_codon:yes stop_codon:yes gene_type:complete